MTVVTAAKKKGNRRAGPKTPWEKFEAARTEALRERFRAGGAMKDLQRAADELQSTIIELERAVWKTGTKV